MNLNTDTTVTIRQTTSLIENPMVKLSYKSTNIKQRLLLYDTY